MWQLVILPHEQIHFMFASLRCTRRVYYAVHVCLGLGGLSLKISTIQAIRSAFPCGPAWSCRVRSVWHHLQLANSCAESQHQLEVDEDMMVAIIMNVSSSKDFFIVSFSLHPLYCSVSSVVCAGIRPHRNHCIEGKCHTCNFTLFSREYQCPPDE